MTASLYPPLPQVPACWSWELPPLPQPSSTFAILAWQNHRCAICAVHMPGVGFRSKLHEDHDHDSGDTRGYLCPRCNTMEGRSAAQVFARYRERPPAAIIGVLVRKGSWTHPETRSAEFDWARAVSTVEDLIRAEQEYRTHCQVEEGAGRIRLTPWGWMSAAFRTRRSISPLVMHALRGGYRLNERRMIREQAVYGFEDLIPLALAQVIPPARDNAMRGAL